MYSTGPTNLLDDDLGGGLVRLTLAVILALEFTPETVWAASIVLVLLVPRVVQGVLAAALTETWIGADLDGLATAVIIVVWRAFEPEYAAFGALPVFAAALLVRLRA